MSGSPFVLAIVAGVALAWPYVRFADRARAPKRVFAIGLVVATCVYVGFALAAGELRASLVESGGVVLFGVVALLGVRWSVYWLVLGWVGHVAWDLLLHPVGVPAYAPWWYPVVCIGFDLLVAGALLRPAGRSLTFLEFLSLRVIRLGVARNA